MKPHQELLCLPFSVSFHSFLHFLLAAAVFFCPADASAANEPQKVMAILGETVILPCKSPHINYMSTVEWTKEGLTPNITFLYRNGYETFQEKHPDFRFRTILSLNEVKDGNFSLKISNLRLSDEGKYECAFRQDRKREVISTLELVVAAVPEPKLSVVPREEGGLTLLCEVKSCWSSPFEMTFLDDQGMEIPSKTAPPPRDSRGCFIITSRVPAPNKFNSSVTCRIHHSEITQTRETYIYIQENCMAPCTLLTIAFGVTAAICGVLCVIVVVLYKRGASCEKTPLPSNSGGNGSPEENYPLVNQADCDRQAELLRENEELKAALQNKNNIIHQQAEELKDLKSRLIPVLQHSRSQSDSRSPADGSKSVNPPAQDSNLKPATSANSNRPKSPRSKNLKPAPSGQDPPPGPQPGRSTHGSCPSLLTDNVRPSTSEDKHRGHTRSLSDSLPRISGAKIPCRHTTSIMCNNPFTVLEDLPENSE